MVRRGSGVRVPSSALANALGRALYTVQLVNLFVRAVAASRWIDRQIESAHWLIAWPVLSAVAVALDVATGGGLSHAIGWGVIFGAVITMRRRPHRRWKYASGEAFREYGPAYDRDARDR